MSDPYWKPQRERWDDQQRRWSQPEEREIKWTNYPRVIWICWCLFWVVTWLFVTPVMYILAAIGGSLNGNDHAGVSALFWCLILSALSGAAIFIPIGKDV